MERLEVEPPELERDPDERDPDERDPDERDEVERDPLERLVVRDPLPELAFEVDDEAFDLVSAERTWSKSLSACLLVLAALRRRAASAVVTSL
ncbi:MAG: hypothetical protein JO363_18610 [Solirubrobacterales bacterium]|nr:hypothetical protein [Solirubrobacterales bacterium]